MQWGGQDFPLPAGVRVIAGAKALPLLSALPGFRPRWPWLGGDLQTLRNALRPPPALPASRRQRLAAPLSGQPGAAASLLLDYPETPRTETPLLLLIHGLGGSEASRYMLIAAAAFLRRGYRVARFNMRGAGPSAATSRGPYHAGLTSDIADALKALQRHDPDMPVIAMGFSLGGHQLLRLGGEGGYPATLKGLITVSAPVDLARTQRRIAAPRNHVYQRSLARAMRRDARRWLDPDDPRSIDLNRFRTVARFDEEMVAPAHGFCDAADYYHRAGMQRVSHAISLPTLILHAADDPWIPATTLQETRWPDHERLLALLTISGGHVGFHGAGNAEPWYIGVCEHWLPLRHSVL